MWSVFIGQGLLPVKLAPRRGRPMTLPAGQMIRLLRRWAAPLFILSSWPAPAALPTALPHPRSFCRQVPDAGRERTALRSACFGPPDTVYHLPLKGNAGQLRHFPSSMRSQRIWGPLFPFFTLGAALISATFPHFFSDRGKTLNESRLSSAYPGGATRPFFPVPAPTGFLSTCLPKGRSHGHQQSNARRAQSALLSRH